MKTRKIELQRAYQPTVRLKLDCGKSLTEQAHKDQTDMNFILRDYAKTGFIKHSKDFEGKYDDISSQDFQEAMFTVANAKNMFESLPAALRKQFGNNPAQFLEFAQNPDNGEKLAKLGVIRGNDGIDINGILSGAPTAENLNFQNKSGQTSVSASENPPGVTPEGE